MLELDYNAFCAGMQRILDARNPHPSAPFLQGRFLGLHDRFSVFRHVCAVPLILCPLF